MDHVNMKLFYSLISVPNKIKFSMLCIRMSHFEQDAVIELLSMHIHRLYLHRALTACAPIHAAKIRALHKVMFSDITR